MPPNPTAPRRPRHDAFTPARRARFLRQLARYGCLTDAARKTKVAVRTVYNHRDKDKAFDRDCAHALRMSGSGLEQTAWERAVEGVDQLFACGGQVYTRKRYSDGLLRMLLQGANPKKYGPRSGFSRKRLHAWERKQLRKEVAAEFFATQRATEAELAESLCHRLDLIEQNEAPKRLAAGWTKDGDNWIPPGWVRAADAGRALPKGDKGDGPPAIP